jgi:hypothetical protein
MCGLSFALFLGDFSSPEKTIKTYYEYYYDRDILSNCFYPPVPINYELKKIWLEYKIVEKKKTEKAGERLFSGVLISKDALEIIVEVKMDHPEKGNPKTKFWYLLQEIHGKWKILEHSHISDEFYPPLD